MEKMLLSPGYLSGLMVIKGKCRKMYVLMFLGFWIILTFMICAGISMHFEDKRNGK